MERFKFEIKEYFFELGNELSELGSDIWKKMLTKKWIQTLLCVGIFIICCFIWKPLGLLTFVGLIKICATFCVMLVPCILTAFCYMLWNLRYITGIEPTYPILNKTLCVICAIVVFLFTTYFAYDWAIRDLWYQPELWEKILNL